ncbi:MAG: N-formylglutamate amidohydrolase [Methylobacter sp.]|nr:N-formylglutamate amidohydrolase [Methylobacter sp.]
MKLIKTTYVIGIFISLLGCSARPLHYDKAIVEPGIVATAIELEDRLNKRQGVTAAEGERWFEVIQGSIPVVITVPHSTAPFREGKRRFSDGGGTAALAVAIGRITGATVIYTTYEGPSDPNFYDDNAFKEQLKAILVKSNPKYVLDIHSSHPYRSYDVDIGTMSGQSLLGNNDLLENLLEHFRREGITHISNNRFAASKNQTITKFSSANGIPAIQLEFNSTWVNPSNGNIQAQRFSLLIQALVRFINSSVEEL